MVKLKTPSILLVLACLAILCAGPVWSADKKSSAWFPIHFNQQPSDLVRDDVCLGPDGRFFTCLDSEAECAGPAQKKEEMPFLPWLASLFPDNEQNGDDASVGTGMKSKGTSASGGSRDCNLRSIQLLLQRTGASDILQLQDKLFDVVQNMLCLILLCLITGFIVMFSRFFHDERTDRAKMAIWGYVLSLDLGFMVFAMQGYWSQDRVLGSNFAYTGSCAGCSPEIVMALLVGCAWYTFLRNKNQPTAPIK